MRLLDNRRRHGLSQWRIEFHNSLRWATLKALISCRTVTVLTMSNLPESHSGRQQIVPDLPNERKNFQFFWHHLTAVLFLRKLGALLGRP